MPARDPESVLAHNLGAQYVNLLSILWPLCDTVCSKLVLKAFTRHVGGHHGLCPNPSCRYGSTYIPRPTAQHSPVGYCVPVKEPQQVLTGPPTWVCWRRATRVPRSPTLLHPWQMEPPLPDRICIDLSIHYPVARAVDCLQEKCTCPFT